MMSADKNIDHGDSSCSEVGTDVSELGAARLVVAVAAVACDAGDGDAGDGDTWDGVVAGV
jgi:hypothetical protein